ncbi:cytochrome P450 [Dictyobacter arantiisoli]|uniref:Putative cytochrome P450 YjiB n=1 Tax=Dictyobacter arantiisoli TaxID=2014874 RepID=A0A5A5TI35_9CHLR|nr:cytochrome P450 [Dictyobacter arantiisoli]GCF10786.1 putative cytochrome P450 YjiB [Dictyobacter arantiisoli]
MKFPAFVNDLSIPPQQYHHQLRNWTSEMRANDPVVYNEENNTWVVFHYDDVVRVQSDFATFSSEHTVKDNQGVSSENGSIIEMDPPRHRAMRSLITQAFSARTINDMAPRIQSIVDELFQKVVAHGQMDWMTELANPLPVIVIAEMLGLPRDKWPEFKQWTDAIINKTSEAGYAQEQFANYFSQAIEEHHKHPGTDVLSRLIAAEVDGKHLDHEGLVNFCFTLLIAGNITTTNVLGNMILCFDEHPDQLARLSEQPELASTAVEEILRYIPPFRSGPNDLLVGRIATTDVMIGEKQIHKGESIEVSRISANFDEQQFTDAQQFDIARTPNRHQSFGHGIHFCVGAPLARLEIKTTLETLPRYFREIQLNHDQPLKQVESRLIFGPRNLPLSFQAR